MSVKVAAHHVQHIDNQGIADGVENLIAGLAINQDILGAQHRQMLRDVGLLDTQPFHKSAGR